MPPADLTPCVSKIQPVDGIANNISTGKHQELHEDLHTPPYRQQSPDQQSAKTSRELQRQMQPTIQHQNQGQQRQIPQHRQAIKPPKPRSRAAARTRKDQPRHGQLKPARRIPDTEAEEQHWIAKTQKRLPKTKHIYAKHTTNNLRQPQIHRSRHIRNPNRDHTIPSPTTIQDRKHQRIAAKNQHDKREVQLNSSHHQCSLPHLNPQSSLSSLRDPDLSPPLVFCLIALGRWYRSTGHLRQPEAVHHLTSGANECCSYRTTTKPRHTNTDSSKSTVVNNGATRSRARPH